MRASVSLPPARNTQAKARITKILLVELCLFITESIRLIVWGSHLGRKIDAVGDGAVVGGPAAERFPSDGCPAYAAFSRAGRANPDIERTAGSEQTCDTSS